MLGLGKGRRGADADDKCGAAERPEKLLPHGGIKPFCPGVTLMVLYARIALQSNF
ncbi:hypothetical protein [Roseivivax sediminis]|uniref:hypothetical protein n=1 Tax=Roseivivax sediminis TaxID=936889 RepID=UPI001CB72A1D|nr:hypothetical protein [Roseivivax sediminis]